MVVSDAADLQGVRARIERIRPKARTAPPSFEAWASRAEAELAWCEAVRVARAARPQRRLAAHRGERE